MVKLEWGDRAVLRLKARAESLAASSGYASIPDGKQDALRHLVGSALVTRAYGSLLSGLAGWLAEVAAWIVRRNTAAQCRMDLHNNRVGRRIGRESGSEAQIVAMAHEAIEHGVARWLADDPSTPHGDRVPPGTESPRAVVGAHGNLVRGSREGDDA